MPKYIITVEDGEEFEVSVEASSKEEALGSLDELLEVSRAVAERMKAESGKRVKKSRKPRSR